LTQNKGEAFKEELGNSHLHETAGSQDKEAEEEKKKIFTEKRLGTLCFQLLGNKKNFSKIKGRETF